jgi:haloalkane dehalogenase
MIMEQNAFVETILPQGILRKLTGKEMDSYRAPFLEREARLPNLVWPRQIPVEGEPADVVAIVEEYGRAMTRSSLPKLLIAGDPGLVIKGRILEFCRTWPNRTEIRVKGAHFLQEDSPQEISGPRCEISYNLFRNPICGFFAYPREKIQCTISVDSQMALAS